ncbi:glycosyltransferase family 4 protein [Acinetobacter indicus]|uniref:glycosyltransferase family 4 protein n=1 Tax=Acinetobacter indicus TaxID=756892 RepID=UPI000FD80665|nr:glycosyltransferase family 4 protein [Acinetobacter indicus]RVT33613.1 glycosyltransferase WbuB [Acinetobacter indicus]
MKKIFLISEYILPEQNTTGYLFHKLHVNLKKHYGQQLKLIVKEDAQHAIEKDAILIKNVNLNKKKLVQRLVFELIISLRFLLKIIFNVKKGDTVFSGTTPVLLLPVIFFAKKIKGFKWVLLVHDVFPENLIPAQVIKKNNFFYKILKFLFDRFYAAADKRIVIGIDMKELIDQKVNKKDSIIIQNWIDHCDIAVQSKQDNPILKRLGWENVQPVFAFFGNIGRVQGIDNIIRALEKIPIGQRPKVLFIGSGAYEEPLKEMIVKLKDDNIKYIGPLDPIRKSDGLNACDVAIVTLADGMYGLGVPSKAYYSMAADKPLLAIMHEGSEISCMVNQLSIGWAVSSGNPQQLAELFLKISEDFINDKMSSPRKILIEHYAEPIAMEKIRSVISDVH